MRARPSPVGRAFPRRPHDHFLLPLPLAVAILLSLARHAENHADNAMHYKVSVSVRARAPRLTVCRIRHILHP